MASRALPQVLSLDGCQDVGSGGLRLDTGEVPQLGLDVGAVPQREDWQWPPVGTRSRLKRKDGDSSSVADAVVASFPV